MWQNITSKAISQTIATNAKNKQEYDYTDENGKDYTSTYNGDAGLQLNFMDRLILGIKMGDIKLALSTEVTGGSKILINRNIITRAKKALPYLIYDENPYKQWLVKSASAQGFKWVCFDESGYGREKRLYKGERR